MTISINVMILAVTIFVNLNILWNTNVVLSFFPQNLGTKERLGIGESTQSFFICRSSHHVNTDLSCRAERKSRNGSYNMKISQQQRQQSKQPRQYFSGVPHPGSIDEWIQYLDSLRTTRDIKLWLEAQKQTIDEEEEWGSSLFGFWDVKEAIIFVRYLQQRHAYDSIIPFISMLDSQFCGRNSAKLIKIYTTALFALSSSGYHNGGRREFHINCEACAYEVLDIIERKDVKPTTLTFIALFGCLHGSGSDSVLRLYNRLQKSYPNVEWNAELYNTAIASCKKGRRGRSQVDIDSNSKSSCDDEHWQAGFFLFQQMQRRHICPTSKTYLALLEVVSNTGKIPVVRSLIRQLQGSGVVVDPTTTNERTEVSQPHFFEVEQTEEATIRERIWIAALNSCSIVGDYRQALLFTKEMTTSTPPTKLNLRHCTSLLKTFAAARRDKLALTALDAMMGNTTSTLYIGGCEHLHLPRTDPDLVALNTVLKCLNHAGNYREARNLFDRIARGDFDDPNGMGKIIPDRISYHCMLMSCRDPLYAKTLVKSMRLSRRFRNDSVPPTNVTYAHAVHVCHRAPEPDLESAMELLEWARDDRIVPTAFMYSPAIWTAQRCGNHSRAIELFGEMEESGCTPDGFSMNGLVCAVCGKGDETLAISLFQAMKKRGHNVMPVTMKRIVAALSDPRIPADGREMYLLQILDLLDDKEMSVKVSGPLFEALISHYGTIGDVDSAVDIAGRIRGHLNAPCLRALLLAYSSTTPVRWEEAVEVLHSSDITDGSLGPGLIDQIALGHALLACSKAGRYEEGMTLLELYGVPADKLSRQSQSVTVSSINSLIASAGRGGRPDVSLALLNKISSLGLQPDGRSYRSAMIACNQAQHEQQRSASFVEQSEADANDNDSFQWWEIALSLLRRMKEDDIVPDKQTYSSAISACEAAGQWQRAVGVLQDILASDRTHESPPDPEEPLSLNLYCWNAVIAACQKGGAWVEALDLYERMLSERHRISPNDVTLNSLIEALDGAGQRELAQSKYHEALLLGIVNPWKRTLDQSGNAVVALDLHRFSKAMAFAAVRQVMDTWCDENDDSGGGISGDLHIITGKGIHSRGEPVLQKVAIGVLKEYNVDCRADASNPGRVVVGYQDLLECFSSKSWR
jgi:pentatricopeptide repeat protein